MLYTEKTIAKFNKGHSNRILVWFTIWYELVVIWLKNEVEYWCATYINFNEEGYILLRTGMSNVIEMNMPRCMTKQESDRW